MRVQNAKQPGVKRVTCGPTFLLRLKRFAIDYEDGDVFVIPHRPRMLVHLPALAPDFGLAVEVAFVLAANVEPVTGEWRRVACHRLRAHFFGEASRHHESKQKAQQHR
ncbi:hypothetical protein [Paraburkholderia xenovorans]